MTDEQLMQRYQSGEFSAFEELYARHSGRLYAFVKSKAKLPGEAEDLLQQVFFNLHRNRLRFDATMPFLPWLFSLTRNAIIDHFRKRRAVPIEEQTLQSLADSRQDTEEVQQPDIEWREVIQLLPEDQRGVIEQRFGQGLTFEQIARMSGINEVSARKRVSRAVQALRKAIVGEGKGAKS